MRCRRRSPNGARKASAPRISMAKFALLALAGLFILLACIVWYAGFHDRGMNRDFDPDFVGTIETRMWRAYYSGGSKAALGMDLLKLMREQFGLSYRTSIRIASDVSNATLAFRGTQEQTDYEQKVLPSLIQGYTRLRTAVRGAWEPEEVARAELGWWVARRMPEPQNAPEIVGQAIALEYSLIYAKDNAHIQRAGVLRAQAARLRDTGAQHADWPAIEIALRESYGELLEGIRQ